jgi:hypothetical protein
MNPRDAMFGPGMLVAVAPLRPGAQVRETGKMRVIGALWLGHSPTSGRIARNPLHARTKELGRVEGKNLIVERRYAEFKAERLAWLLPGEYAETLSDGRLDMAPVMEAAVKSLGFETRFYDVRKSEDIGLAFDEVRKWRAQALSAAGAHVAAAQQRIAEFALRERLPSVFPQAANVKAGGLLSYGNVRAEFLWLLSTNVSHVDKILRVA